MILNFPKKPKRRSTAKRPAGGPAALVHQFPSARHATIVSTVVMLMKRAAKRASGDPLDAAEDVLLGHLNVVWSILGDRGVTEAEREVEVRDFARVAWAKFGYRSDRSGVA